MQDVIFLVIGTGFFVVAWGLVALLDRLREH